MDGGAQAVASAAYLVLLAVLGGTLGLHRAALLYWVARSAPPLPEPARPPQEWPQVTVQLPLYDEAAVAARLLEATGRLDYPRDRLLVQVLDDSDDETCGIVDAGVERLRAAGIEAEVLRRPRRDGYKAGALALGLARAQGELVAVFDADFVPPEEFLRRTVPCFADPTVGLVQARWDHLGHCGLLGRVQALLLDAHFLVEHAGRWRSGRPINFNGTAGVLRRSAIQAAGGWSADTLTEDLDLSIRLGLLGWRSVFLEDLAVPAELPADMPAFRGQQRRWVKGSGQTARKLLGAVWTSPGPDLATRVELSAQVLLNGSYALSLGLVLATVPLLLAALPRELPWLESGLSWAFWGSTLSVGAFLLLGQARRSTARLLLALPLLPAAFALCLGLSLSSGLAYLSGWLGGSEPFVRTPKRGDGAPRYRAGLAIAPALAELGLAAWCAWGALRSLLDGVAPWAGVLLLLFAAGFAWVGGATLVDAALRRPRPAC